MTANHYFRPHNITAAIGFLVAIPAIVFVTLNLLKYQFGVLPGIDVPAFHPAVLLGGGMAAVLLNAWSILEFRISRENRKVWLSFGFTWRPWNIAVLGVAGLFLLILVAYVILENLAHALGG